MIEGIRNQGNQPKSREGNDNKGVGERGTQAKLGEWDDYVESEEVQYWYEYQLIRYQAAQGKGDRDPMPEEVLLSQAEPGEPAIEEVD